MRATHPVFAIGALAISLLTAWFVAQLSPVPSPKRYGSLDGLRGLLAMLVMIAHASAWRLYAMTGEWTEPPSSCTHFAKAAWRCFHDHRLPLARSCSKAASAQSTGFAWYVAALRVIRCIFICRRHGRRLDRLVRAGAS